MAPTACGYFAALVLRNEYLAASALFGGCFAAVAAWADTLPPTSLWPPLSCSCLENDGLPQLADTLLLLSRGHFAVLIVSGGCFATAASLSVLATWCCVFFSSACPIG
jgi:hypothetical protein